MAENPPAGGPGAGSAYLPAAAPHPNEGKTVAAWVAMIGTTVGAVIAAAGFVGPWPWVIAAGAAVVVAALVAGAVLRSLGHGQPLPQSTPRPQAAPSSGREPRA